MFQKIILMLLNLIESWPNWPSRFINIFGPKDVENTLINILKSKIQSILYVSIKS